MPRDSRAGDADAGVLVDLAAVVAELTEQFPDLPADVVTRNVADAADAVGFFGIDGDEAPLVGRLARAHLEALDELRRREGA
jgi:hypothetical protein